MIAMHHHGPRCGPKIVCDHCGRRIADAQQGAVLWDGSKQDAPPVFCCVGPCLRALEDRYPDWLPLSAWLIYLANGTRLKWLKAGKLAVMLGEVG